MRDKRKAAGGKPAATDDGTAGRLSSVSSIHPHTPVCQEPLERLAMYLCNPEPGDPQRDPSMLGDPLDYDSLSPFAALLQHGMAPADVLALMSPELRAIVAATDPHSTPESRFMGSTMADLDSILSAVTWEWRPWLPHGFLVSLLADQDMGKSLVLLRAVASYLRGDPWLDGTPFTGELGKVVWCEAESSQGLNWDRAIKWGLPRDNILFPLSDPMDDVLLDNPDHVQAIENAARLDDVRAVFLDSLTGTTLQDMNKARTFHLTKILAELARNLRKVVIASHHIRKLSLLDERGVVTLQQARGSGAILQTARVVWAIDAPDPNDPDTRRLSQVKNNLLGKGASLPLGFRITKGDRDEPVLTLCDAPTMPKTETQADKATDLLLALLRSGPVRATELQGEFEGAGISWDAANYAKKTAHIVSIRKGGVWYWSLSAPEATQGTLYDD